MWKYSFNTNKNKSNKKILIWMNIKYDVLSIPPSVMIELIYKCGIHAHSNKSSYIYRSTYYVTFMKTDGVMKKKFTV